MSPTASTICKTFGDILLAPPALLAESWDSNNNPATAKKTMPKGKNQSSDRRHEVKTDSRGQSTTRFGDGQTGRRPPHGRQGITDRYRQGKSTSTRSTTVKPKQDKRKIDKKK